jgi:ribosomal-protein-alanine N-acetyltransferase
MNFNTDITIRQFTPADLVEITALEKSVYGSGAYSTFFFRQLHDLFPTLLWVAEDDGKLVGHVCGAVTLGGRVGWVLNTAVLAHYRRQRIGQRLLERCLEELRAAGVERIRTTSEPENVAVIRLYEKLGFHKIGVGENYYGEGSDRFLFECN